MTPTEHPRNDVQIQCSLGDGGTITINAASLPRDTVARILELLLEPAVAAPRTLEPSSCTATVTVPDDDASIEFRGRVVYCDGNGHDHGLHAGRVQSNDGTTFGRYGWPIAEPEVHHPSGHHPTGSTCAVCVDLKVADQEPRTCRARSAHGFGRCVADAGHEPGHVWEHQP